MIHTRLIESLPKKSFHVLFYLIKFLILLKVQNQTSLFFDQIEGDQLVLLNIKRTEDVHTDTQ